MDIDIIINDSISDLSKAKKVYLMFTDLTAFKNTDANSDEFRKLKYAIVRSDMFEKHTDDALRLSALGLRVVSEFDGDYFKYKESLKPKKDFFKIFTAITTTASIILLYMNFSINNKAQLLEQKIVEDKITIDSLNVKIDLQQKIINSKIVNSKTN